MKSSIASGASWMVLFKLIDRILGLVSTLLLARLLVPADFGLVAMAMSVLTIIDVATSFNFEVALIQRREVERIHYDSAWTLNILLAVACGSVTALLAYPTALFYSEPRLTAVMLVLAGGWMLGGTENIATVDFRRRLDFRREFSYLVVRRTLTFLLTVILALSLRSYWALVAGSVGGKLIGVLLSYLMHPFRPRPCLQAARELIGFSGWTLASNLVLALQFKLPHFVVGRSLGAGPLGVFTIATELAQIPSSDLILPIHRAIFPGFSRMAGDVALLRSTFLDVVAMVMLLVIPAAVGIAAVADPMVRTLFGEKWMDAVPLIQVMSLASALAVVTWNNASVYLAMGRPRLLTLVVTVRLLILVPAAVVLTQAMGLLGAALAELLASLLILGFSLHLMFRQLGLSHARFFSRMWRPFVGSALMAAGVQLVLDLMPSDTIGQSALQLLVGIAAGFLLYAIAILLLWLVSGRPDGAERILLRRLAPMLKRVG